MKKKYLQIKSLKLITAIILTISLFIEPLQAFAASNSYSDHELQSAVNNGFGEYKPTDPQVTYAQFMRMLDCLVGISNQTKLVDWMKELPKARTSNNRMTRFNGMLAIMYVADFLGGKYTEFNEDDLWITNNKIGDQWKKCIADPEIWGDWLNKNVNVGFMNTLNARDWSHYAVAYFYSFGRQSEYVRKTIFDYSPSKNSMRPDEKFTYKEALLAVNRLYESVVPDVSERYATAEDKAILDNAQVRKQAILNSPTTVKVTGTSYYVSSEGNDDSDGLTPETAWATIDKVNNAVFKDGDGVFFKRGDLWRGVFFYGQDGVTYSAYGVGQKPRFYGSLENSSGPDKWKLIDGSKNIWVYYRDMPSCGYMVFNDGESFAEKKWVYWNGTQYIKDGTDEEFNVNSLKNLEYFNDINLTGWDYFVGSDMFVFNCTRTGKLYLRCDAGNPGVIYRSIEISPTSDKLSVIRLRNNNLIDNLCIQYYGNCGIMGAGTIQNCEFAYLGGSNFGFIAKDKSASGAGGGINIDPSLSSTNIMNNYFHESYDEGITTESGWNGEDFYNASYSNITIKDNLFEKNGHSCLLSAYNNSSEGIMFKNITYEGNYFMYSGYPSGSSSRIVARDRTGFALYDYGERNIENVKVTNNTFYIGRFALVFFHITQPADVTFSGNKYFLNNNAVFVAYDSENYYMIDKNSPKEYLNDQTATVSTKSSPPSLSIKTATIKVKETYTIPVENMNSITKVTYKITSGSKYISVSSEGIVTAKKAGTAKITVTFSNGINKDIEQIFTVNVKK